VKSLERLQRRAYHVVEAADDRASRAFQLSISALIILSVVAVILETVASLHADYHVAFDAFELLTVAVFTVEYAVRLWACVVDPRYGKNWWGRLRFALTPAAVIDLVAILPFYLESSVDLRFIRAMRLVRLARILKFGRYSESLETLSAVTKEKREDLVVTGSIGFVLLVVVSGLMYFVENPRQPKVFSSIPAAMWWGITTLTTVGYGDIYPVTPAGKFLAAITAVLGVGMFALPAGILGSAFVVELQKKHHHGLKSCPHCGKLLS
jgi:voltage-gated potassium channel